MAEKFPESFLSDSSPNATIEDVLLAFKEGFFYAMKTNLFLLILSYHSMGVGWGGGLGSDTYHVYNIKKVTK